VHGHKVVRVNDVDWCGALRMRARIRARCGAERRCRFRCALPRWRWDAGAVRRLLKGCRGDVERAAARFRTSVIPWISWT